MKKECPACRKQIGSRRLLRNDVRTETIISRLVSDIDKYNNLQQQEREKEIKHFDFQAFNKRMQVLQAQQESIVQMEKYQKIEEKQRKKREILERMQTRKERKRKDSSDIDSDSEEKSQPSSDHEE